MKATGAPHLNTPIRHSSIPTPHFHWRQCDVRNCHIPTWRVLIQVRINIIVFVKIMDYSSVFHVLIDVSSNMKLKYNEALS
jgi:hypothetical protein